MILLNGQPLDPTQLIDLEVIEEAFTFHFIHKPQRARGTTKRVPRRHSSVRQIPVEQYLAEKGGQDSQANR